MIQLAKRFSAALLVALALGGGLAASAAVAAQGDPVYVYMAPRTGEKGPGEVPPPGTGFEGPCGLASKSGALLVSDYYHHAIDFFSEGNSLSYNGQIANEDPLDGPCGLAYDDGGNLWVNNYHRNVVRLGGGALPSTVIDEAEPTGVAVDPLTNTIYVDDRTYIAAYEESGEPVLVGGQPLRIGVGDLEDGYGAAAYNGRVYVADAGDNAIKAYEPATDPDTPVKTIAGHLPGGFVSLRDAALAVSGAESKIYVVDDLQPGVAEEPEAAVEAYNTATGSYIGRLKFNVVDAEPVGLAVGAGGRVYVTSGNTSQASVYAYEADAPGSFSAPAALSLRVASGGVGSGSVRSAAVFGVDCGGACTAPIRSGATVALSADPASGSSFAGWSGACSGLGSCVVTVAEATSVEASFALSEPGTVAGPSAPAAAGSPAKPAAVRRRVRLQRRHRHHQQRHHAHHRGRGEGR